MIAKDKQDSQGPGTEPEVSQTETATTSKTIETPNVGENNQSIPPTMENPILQSHIPPVASENTGNPSTSKNQCNFQMEKPKLPRFAGDVRDYAIFKADFKHTVESRYGKRDAITILRASLQGKPILRFRVR
jgi:hypothetical protein